MILSDKSIREELAAGRIVIEPLDESAVQPSSVDLHVDRYFRVFRNDTTPFIDPKEAQEDLTELVTMTDGRAFILHPGEFVLGSTLERVRLPDDLVARLEGKSSLGRLGLLIHSSLPGSETVPVLSDDGLRHRRIEDVVRKRLRGEVVAFNPDTFDVEYQQITGWYEGPPDRIFEVRTASGRRVRVTAGHNFFSLDRHGQLARVRTQQLQAGVRIAIPHQIPDPPEPRRQIDLLDLIPEPFRREVLCQGPWAAGLFQRFPDEIGRMFREAGMQKHTSYYRSRARLPLTMALQLGEPRQGFGQDDRLTVRRSLQGLPLRFELTTDLAWLLGIYVAEGSRRGQQFTISNTDQATLDRIEAILRGLRLLTYRASGAVTCCSSFASAVLAWLGTGDGAYGKRIPPVLFGASREVLRSFLEGVVDGDGSREPSRTSVWTTSDGMVQDLLFLASRLGRRAGTTTRPTSRLHHVYLPEHEHKLDPLVDGSLLWDPVVEVRDTETVEPIYDLEVRPSGAPVENFLAGDGGIFVSNTAGFVDAGWDGHLTLELSNVANLPIAIYPGMKIGQVSFLRMSTPAERPYGSKGTRSKYQGQGGPTPSRYYLNFEQE